MTRLSQLQVTLSNHLLSTSEQVSLKGKGMGNMVTKDGKNCPPPVDEGKLGINERFM